MVKKLAGILFTILGLYQFIQAQDSLMYGIFPVDNNKITYKKNISVDSISKDELLKRGRHWASIVFKAQKDNAQMEDKDQTSLIYYGSITTLFHETGKRRAVEWNCRQHISIICEDNKARFIVTDLEQRAPSGYGSVTIVKLEEIKSKTDSLPESVFFGKNNKANYWKSELATFKDIDKKIKTLMASLEKALRYNKFD